ncbi:hypothetical protein DEU56DRAFT_800065 [Suillus clintonianus]|uniref:uncharacterized protein n=1 Tax=Suillus clintonianus TaxID=1904413 RepID=UPI001B882E5B|nr:uncharacterized protein DEU56DRAFT_800065 [Suillus clintonianus]KAG2139746.1 hypothetical protein DEU56DRAFT_800065 [Suillus clintonianus]
MQWFSTLASSLRPVISSNVVESTDSSESDKTAAVETGKGWGVVRKSLFDKPSQVAGALYSQVDHPLIHQGAAAVSSLGEKLGSLPASAQTLYGGLHFPNAGKSCWDKFTGLGPNIQGCTNEFFQRAKEFHPSNKMTELRKSVDGITSTATNLHQVVKGAAEQRGIPLRSILQELGNAFSALFEELKEQFPPPEEAPGHEKRMAMINTVLDRLEEIFLHVAIKVGASEELLRSLTSSLKSGVKHVVVTIGDVGEQHPQLVWALSGIVFSMLFAEGLLFMVLRIVGFGPLGPMKGGIAAWLQGWLFGPAVPKGGWFAMLQRLAMLGGKRL